MGATSQILKNKLAILWNIDFNIVKHVPLHSWVGLLLYCPRNPILLSLRCCIQSLTTSFQGTQCIPDHNITPPLAHISPGGDFPSQGVHFFLTEKFILFLEKTTLRGGMPLFLVEKFFPLFGETTHPEECPFSLPRYSFCYLWDPSSWNAPSSHWKVPYAP